MCRFGDVLAELRKDKKLSQRELGHILHVSVGTISNYETGAHLPDVEKLVNLADFFGVTTDYLLGRCESTASPDVFSEPLTADRTVGGFIKVIRSLPTENKEALALILRDMELCMTIGQYAKKESL